MHLDKQNHLSSHYYWLYSSRINLKGFVAVFVQLTAKKTKSHKNTNLSPGPVKKRRGVCSVNRQTASKERSKRETYSLQLYRLPPSPSRGSQPEREFQYLQSEKLIQAFCLEVCLQKNIGIFLGSRNYYFIDIQQVPRYLVKMFC